MSDNLPPPDYLASLAKVGTAAFLTGCLLMRAKIAQTMIDEAQQEPDATRRLSMVAQARDVLREGLPDMPQIYKGTK